MARLNWWPGPVTQIPFHSAGTERKRERQKRGESRSERESESEAGKKGGEGERGRKPRDICS